jgi:proton-translocating NADH-quinone oxidoreductase chain M
MSWKAINFMKKEFLLSLYVILILLIGVFTILDVLGFYILFEGILIPMFIVIGVWGSREEKVKAAFYFFFYTLIGSLLMLASIFKIYSIYGTTNYLTLVCCDMPSHLQFWLFLGFFCSLAVKIPMIPTHIWLPQAHVEAPIAGSVLLAGILLKLGGYGFIRFSFPLFPIASEFLAPFIILLSIIAIIYASFTTCRQTDVKRLIAYSSVAHMGLVTLALFTHSFEGLIASMVMMLAHGLVSSGLFMTSAVVYVRHHSRAIRYFRGITTIMPIFSSLALILILANIGFPLTFNFIAEFLAILAALNYSYLVGVLSCIGALLSVVYALYFYNRIYFGQLSPHLAFGRDVNAFEFQGFLPLIILTLLLGVLPNLVLTLLNSGAYYNISL